MILHPSIQILELANFKAFYQLQICVVKVVPADPQPTVKHPTRLLSKRYCTCISITANHIFIKNKCSEERKRRLASFKLNEHTNIESCSDRIVESVTYLNFRNTTANQQKLRTTDQSTDQPTDGYKGSHGCSLGHGRKKNRQKDKVNCRGRFAP